MPTRQTKYGFPFQIPRSTTTTVVVEPTLGFRSDQPPTDLLPGQTPTAENYIMREGGLEPRPRLSTVSANENPLHVAVTGGMEAVSSTGSVYPFISGTTRSAWFSNGSWSATSWVGTVQPSGSATQYYDLTQIYLARIDDNIVVGAGGSYETLVSWQVGSGVLSRLTGAPRSKYCATHDNFVIAFNIVDSAGTPRYVQRYQTSARGDPEVWSGNVNNFSEDLLEARGEGTRVVAHESRVVFFFEREIWVAYRDQYPAIYRSQVLDKTVGTSLSWTVVVTPIGIIFLGDDFMLYLLPKEGGPAAPIGQAIQKTLRETIDNPSLAHAVYDDSLSAYRLFVAVRGGTGVPTTEWTLHLPTMTIAPQTYRHGITRAFPAYLQSAAAGTTWSAVSGVYTWATIPGTWGQYASTSTKVNRVTYLGSSTGTVYFADANGSSDDGRPVTSRWRSGGFGGGRLTTMKTITQVTADYIAASSSSLSIRASVENGSRMIEAPRANLPAGSYVSQAIAHVYAADRYPQIEVTSEDRGYRVLRFEVQMREGGR